MLILISPSKTQDFKTPAVKAFTQVRQLAQSQVLIDNLRLLKREQLSQLMKLSPKLSQLNWQRYQDFQQPFTVNNAKQALFAFKGDVYNGIDAEHYSAQQLDFAQQHLRILSGLYGVLRPLDLIQAYRLEMGIKLAHSTGKNLYDFWGEQLTELLNEDIKKNQPRTIINLASLEYFKAIKPKLLNIPVLTPVFKENKQGVFKVVAIHAKRARGLMANYIIKNQLQHKEQLKDFSDNRYQFNEELSSPQQWVFSR